MPMHQTRDNPDPKNILADDQKRERRVSDRAQGVDQYFWMVEVTARAKPRQAQG